MANFAQRLVNDGHLPAEVLNKAVNVGQILGKMGGAKNGHGRIINGS